MFVNINSISIWIGNPKPHSRRFRLASSVLKTNMSFFRKVYIYTCMFMALMRNKSIQIHLRFYIILLYVVLYIYISIILPLLLSLLGLNSYCPSWLAMRRCPAACGCLYSLFRLQCGKHSTMCLIPIGYTN